MKVMCPICGSERDVNRKYLEHGGVVEVSCGLFAIHPGCGTTYYVSMSLDGEVLITKIRPKVYKV